MAALCCLNCACCKAVWILNDVLDTLIRRALEQRPCGSSISGSLIAGLLSSAYAARPCKVPESMSSGPDYCPVNLFPGQAD